MIFTPVVYPFVAFYRVTLNVTSEQCDRVVTDRDSQQFADLERKLTDAIGGLFEDLPGSAKVNIVAIR